MTGTLVRRLARLEAAAAVQGEFSHLSMEQLMGLITAVERQIAADNADLANDRT
jgi:hypothetical protein